MKTYSLEELTDKYICKKGTKKRNEFKNELRLDLLEEAINLIYMKQRITLCGSLCLLCVSLCNN